MQKENRELMLQAREALQGQWGSAVAATLIYLVLTGVISAVPRVGWIGALIVDGPLVLGFNVFFLRLARREEPHLAGLFEGFQRFPQALATYLWLIFFLFLWFLLLIIPGIVAALSYSQTFFLMADDPKLSGREALRKSRALMFGNRWKLFCLFCRFIGWFLLGAITLGLAFLWIIPYLQTALAGFYEDLKAAQETVEVSTEPPATQSAS